MDYLKKAKENWKPLLIIIGIVSLVIIQSSNIPKEYFFVLIIAVLLIILISFFLNPEPKTLKPKDILYYVNMLKEYYGTRKEYPSVSKDLRYLSTCQHAWLKSGNTMLALLIELVDVTLPQNHAKYESGQYDQLSPETYIVFDWKEEYTTKLDYRLKDILYLPNITEKLIDLGILNPIRQKVTYVKPRQQEEKEIRYESQTDDN